MPKKRGAPTTSKAWERGFLSIEKLPGGNLMVVCKFCSGTFKGPSTRFRHHFLGTSKKGISACSWSEVAKHPELDEEKQTLLADLQKEEGQRQRAQKREEAAAANIYTSLFTTRGATA